MRPSDVPEHVLADVREQLDVLEAIVYKGYVILRGRPGTHPHYAVAKGGHILREWSFLSYALAFIEAHIRETADAPVA